MHVTISFTEIELIIGHNLYTLDTNSLLGLPSPFLPRLKGLGGYFKLAPIYRS